MKTKTFRVWTHQDLAPIEVEATSRKEALAKAAAVCAESPRMLPAYECAGYYCDGNGKPVESHFRPASPATPLDEPFACVKPKLSTFRRF